MANQTTKAWEQKLEDAGARADAELKRVIAYLNDEVVPEVRRNGSKALRSAAEELRRLAERMEGPASATPPGEPGGDGR